MLVFVMSGFLAVQLEEDSNEHFNRYQVPSSLVSTQSQRDEGSPYCVFAFYFLHVSIVEISVRKSRDKG